MSAEETPEGEESEPAEATPATEAALPVSGDPAAQAVHVGAAGQAPPVVVRPSESVGLIGDMRASTLGMSVVLLIVAVQQIAWIIEPDVFGTLINAVTDEARTWQDLLDDLPTWGLVVAVNTIATALRRLGSDYVYTRMYARVAEGLARRARNSHADPGQTAALSELGRDFVSFFEDRVPEAMTDLVTLVGVTGFLFSYATGIGATCLAVMVPILVTVRVTSIAITKLTTELHELREQNVEVFAANDPALVLAHFTRVSALKRSIGMYTAGN